MQLTKRQQSKSTKKSANFCRPITRFLDRYLQTKTLGSAFLIKCSGKYKECDKEEKKEFQEACLKTLIEVVEKQEAIKNQREFSEEMSPKVVQHMKNVNDKAALPRCDASCRMCNSLCIKAANHDTQDRPHDAVHQPGGVAGTHYVYTEELDHKTCSQSYEEDDTFHLDNRFDFRLSLQRLCQGLSWMEKS